MSNKGVSLGVQEVQTSSDEPMSQKCHSCNYKLLFEQVKWLLHKKGEGESNASFEDAVFITCVNNVFKFVEQREEKEKEDK